MATSGLFRGGEFPRLLVLLALMVVGWPMAMFYAFSQKDAAPPPPPPTLAGATALPPPDEAIELQGVRDRVAFSKRDNPGYSLLFKRTRGTASEKLADQARRDVVFSQLIERPERFRGLPMHVDMVARRVTLQDGIDPSIAPGKKFYEAWAFSKDSQGYPWVLAFEDAPKDLPLGAEVFARIGFDGYFFKLIAYQDGSVKDAGKATFRYAPLLVGRITSFQAPNPAAGAPAAGFDFSWKNIVYTVLVVASLYLLLRIGMVARRQFFPPPIRPIGSKPAEAIEPGDLSRWLHGEEAVEEVAEPDGIIDRVEVATAPIDLLSPSAPILSDSPESAANPGPPEHVSSPPTDPAGLPEADGATRIEEAVAESPLREAEDPPRTAAEPRLDGPAPSEGVAGFSETAPPSRGELIAGKSA